jgi:hypothetical protein
MTALHAAFTRFWPVWIAIGFPAVLILLNATPIATDFVFVLIGIPALLIVWTCLGISALIVSIQHARRLDWSRAVVCAVLPLVILGAGTQHWRFLHFCNGAGDVVHFLVERPFYMQQISSMPSTAGPRLIVFNRGGMIWASRGYVYDESDEIMRDESLQSSSWKTRAEKTELGCGYSAEPFPGHFWFGRHWYLAAFPC